MKKQKKVTLPLSETAKKILELKRLDQEKLKTYRQKFGTATEFLNSCYPRLAAGAPRKLREGAVMELTTHHLEAAEKRLEMCARCPEHGGACHEDQVGHTPGMLPVWGIGARNKTSLLLQPCERWREWVIRQRVMRVGVEKRMAGIAMDDVEPLVIKKTARRVGEFIKGCRDQENNNLVLCGPSSAGVAVAVVRALLASIPDLPILYKRCPALANPMKKYFGDPQNEPDPRPELKAIELLVITQTVIYERPEWLDEELRELVYSRYLDSRPTILATTQQDMGHLISNHYFNTDVPVCYIK